MKLYAQTTAFIALLAVRTTLSIAVAAPPCGLADLVIAPGDISGEFSLCNSITNGGEVRVVGAGATFRAGSVTLANGFSVASGAPFTVETGLFSPGGVIPAGDPSGLELAFNVSGLTQLVSRVSIRLEVTHPFAGDLTATLTSPGGVAHLVLLGRPGHRPAFAGGNAGHSSNFAGAYLFDDFAAGDLWATISGLGADDSIPSGAYRTSTPAPFGPGGALLSNAGGCSTYLSGAFSGLTAAQANGTWILTLVDDASAAPTGSVGAASLFIEESPTVNPNPIQGSTVRGTCTPAPYDFTGTGRTSFAVARGVFPDIQWLIKGNDGTATGQPEQSFTFGLGATDFLVPNDYDGDGIWDAATWRIGSVGKLSIRRSSRPTDVPLEFDLGQTDDVPSISGDYDGDGVADPAVHRLPSISPSSGQFIAIPSSLGGLVTAGFPTVVGTYVTAFPEGGFDHTGDGIADLSIQRPNEGVFDPDNPPECALWTVFDGSGGSVVEEFLFGYPSTDWIVPGDRAGNALADTTVVRNVSGQLRWFVRDTEVGTTGSSSHCFDAFDARHDAAVFGVSGDWLLTGDFDGNGLDDFAVWRPVVVDSILPCEHGTPPSVYCEGFIVGEPPVPLTNNPDLATVVLEFRYGIAGDLPLASMHVQ